VAGPHVSGWGWLASPVSGGRQERALACGPAQEEGRAGHLAGPKEKEGQRPLGPVGARGVAAGWASGQEPRK
jgi:hypothetical protein